MLEKIYKSQAVILQLRDGILGKHGTGPQIMFFTKAKKNYSSCTSSLCLLPNYVAYYGYSRIFPVFC